MPFLWVGVTVHCSWTLSGGVALSLIFSGWALQNATRRKGARPGTSALRRASRPNKWRALHSLSLFASLWGIHLFLGRGVPTAYGLISQNEIVR